MNKRGHSQLGFTIVELLIVIIVIAILATITIVSYNGIQQRAKTASSLSTVDIVRDKALTWYALLNSYPDVAQLRTNSLTPADMDTPGGAAGPAEAKLDDPNIAIGASMDATRSNNGKTVTYAPCGTFGNFTGFQITYWDFTGGGSAVTVTVGTCP
jgi:prepilin-type N-terminal cleavage/methylation domain-containing protein